MTFKITDKINTIDVLYKGILPSIFRNNQGVVVEGYFNNKKLFIANKVFAKHDEKYIPKNNIKIN